MASNDVFLLDQLLLENQNKIAPELDEAQYFELFAAELLLKNYGLSYDEIEAGVMGGGNDGGIDAIYAFVDGELVVPESDFKDAKVIELLVIQAKRSKGYTENAIHSLNATFRDLLDLETGVETFASAYSSDLIGFFREFQNVYRTLATKFPKLIISFAYVTKGDSAEVHPNVQRQTTGLHDSIQQRFSDFEFSFRFYGARDLLNLARKLSVPSLKLRITESLSPADGGYVCLVSIREFFNFITDDEGKRRQIIFDANVREYEGSVEVNKGIRHTLQNRDAKINFWWLNNGITIVAAKASLVSKDLILDDAKVVNGLQTSQEIYKYLSSEPKFEDNRLILARVVVTDDESVRNDIIRATNSQSRIPSYSLRATEQIHHDIEQDFLHNGLYYDRQKNFYKNQGKPKSQIISIQYLAQAVGAIILQRPNDSRGRPTSLIKSEDVYNQIFNTDYPISLYLRCARLMRRIDNYLRTSAPEYIARERTNLRYTLAMYTAGRLVGATKITAKSFVKASLDDVDESLMRENAENVWQVFDNLKKSKSLDGDLIAKNKDFDAAVLVSLKQSLDS